MVRRTPERDRKYLESKTILPADDIPAAADCNRRGAVTLTRREGAVVSRDCHTLCFSRFTQVQSGAGGAINGKLSIKLFVRFALNA
jgi:hypothetical protein